MAFAYVVRGSEDGNIGAYGKKSRAIDRAIEYLDINGNMPEADKVSARFKLNKDVIRMNWAEWEFEAHVSIEKFRLE